MNSNKSHICGSKPTGRLTSKLRCSRTHERHETRRVDDTSASLEALLGVHGVVLHRNDGVFAAPPDAFDVDLHRKVPDLLLSVESVIIRGMHDPCIVELHPHKLSVRFFCQDHVRVLKGGFGHGPDREDMIYVP